MITYYRIPSTKVCSDEGGMAAWQIINAVAVARIMNCTLILPLFKQDSIWKDTTCARGSF